MFRIMSIATLVLIAICFFVGASIAFADENALTGLDAVSEHINDATGPVDDSFVDNLAEADVYDFSDYFDGTVTVPAVDAEAIEESVGARFETVSC
ncbi:MAG: hypothetical protein JNL25_16760 [Rhodospirillaceae bacterium]|nr:hypothetical protein [Rhodospirillaceae bacterium]